MTTNGSRLRRNVFRVVFNARENVNGTTLLCAHACVTEFVLSGALYMLTDNVLYLVP